MNYLSVENLSKSYGIKILFEKLTFGISKGDKMALIANNGTGKSSLLKIIAGNDVAEEGKVTLRTGIRIGYLSQEPNYEEEFSINEIIEKSNTLVMNIIREYEEALQAQMDNYNEQTQKQYDDVTNKMDNASAWDYQDRMKQILSQFKITDLTARVESLSGGQKKRLALAILLLDEPELLLLDEPTNHLDIEMIEWLERYLQKQNITLLMVTHDRYFLDRVCNHILELEDGNLYNHKGNYAYFLEKKMERELVFDTEISKANKLMKKELEWIRRSPKARTTKSKSRISDFHKTKDKANSKKVKQELSLQVKMSRVGGKILELKKVYKSFGDKKILSGFDYVFRNRERIGIIGKNGVGKTTFLDIITEKQKADSGKINIGETIVYGYFTQEGIKLKEDKRVIEVLKDIAEVIVMADGKKVTASTLLQHFMFTPEMQYTYVSKLSGGERRRLYLLTILMKNPNFLILDEPTNDLDLLTLNKLEEFLLNFNGCLILVSHDRYFMDKLTEHLFIFKGDAIIEDHYCSYSEFRNKQIKEVKQKKQKLDNTKKNNNSQAKKLSYKENKEYNSLEKEIKLLENEKEKLEIELNTSSSNADIITKNSILIAKLIQEIDDKSFRWLELDEKLM
jgi:ABC transport system ATP-binding/permease protein